MQEPVAQRVGFGVGELGLVVQAEQSGPGRQVTNEAGYEIYAWDAETTAGTVPMMIIAASVLVVEGLVRHDS